MGWFRVGVRVRVRVRLGASIGLVDEELEGR